jgi:hypothetical protein
VRLDVQQLQGRGIVAYRVPTAGICQHELFPWGNGLLEWSGEVQEIHEHDLRRGRVGKGDPAAAVLRASRQLQSVGCLVLNTLQSGGPMCDGGGVMVGRGVRVGEGEGCVLPWATRTRRWMA